MKPEIRPTLVGDIGGTNSRFAVVSREHGAGKALRIDHFWKTGNDSFRSFDDALAAYVQTTGKPPPRAVFAVAGPVADNAVELTNRPWSLNAQRLEDKFGIARIDVINDFVAMARSAPELTADQLVEIAPGEHVHGPIAVAGAGTGFGQAYLSPLGDDWFVLPGQGGHRAFGPQNELEFEITRRLKTLDGYVSVESVAGGINYDKVLGVLQDIHDVPREAIPPADAMARAERGDPVCLALCHLRADTIMTAGGDAVLASVARGGLVLAGGVTERLIDYIRRPEAIDRFRNRGPMSDFMATIPVKLIKCPEAPLIGAASYKAPNA